MFNDRTIKSPFEYALAGRRGRAAAGSSPAPKSEAHQFRHSCPIDHDACTGEGLRSSPGVVECSHSQGSADKEFPPVSPSVSSDGSWSSDASVWSASAVSVTVREDPTRVTIGLTGEIHAANARTLQTQLRDLINAHAAQQVVIDLSQVEFCDLAGLRLLLGTQQYAIGHAVSCEFVRPAPSVVYLTRLLYGETSPLGVD